LEKWPILNNLFKIINSNRIFAIIITIFILALSFSLFMRGGKDLKVSIYGAQQTLHKLSPYQNPIETDPRTLFRYAPGFAIMIYPFLLKSKMYRMVEFSLRIDDIMPSLFAWYFFKILLLFIIAAIMLKIIPSPSKEISTRNLKISILMALPFIGCELANGQNKIIALFFIILALWLFEKKLLFLSALCFNAALTVYIPLFIFAFYFVIRKKEFIFSFILTALIIFLIFPSLVFGFNFNIYLLKEWFIHNIKPFLLTDSYATYIDLRRSSQSLPSTIGRIFASGDCKNYIYFISPLVIHTIIRIASASITLFSCIALLKRPKAFSQGLGYAILLILSLILPQYCLTYTWCFALVFYFAIFNYLSYPQVPIRLKKALISLMAILFIASICIGLKAFNDFSGLFWTTFFLWAGITGTLMQEAYAKHNPHP
jgi:hypothetical protein